MNETIGKYEVIEPIAQGGFGMVWKARHPYMKRLVAIKTCALADDETRRRFFREAEIAGRLDHPNVTLVHDFGVEGESAYLVQEYLSGEDLLAKIRRGDPIPLAVRLDWLRQAALGLAYAHSRGIVHRDVKPANLRVLENGQVKVMDFGIAKLATAATRLTREGMTVGTVGYLAPEQLADGKVDARSDVFSFGVVAYELLTFRKAFPGPGLSEVMRQIVHEHPRRLEEIWPQCPPPLAAFVEQCLRKRPEDRFASFDDIVAELDRMLALPEVAMAPVPGQVAEPLPATELDTAPISVLRAPEEASGPPAAAEALSSPPSAPPGGDLLPGIDQTVPAAVPPPSPASPPPPAPTQRGAPSSPAPSPDRPPTGSEARRRPSPATIAALAGGGLLLAVALLAWWVAYGGAQREEASEAGPAPTPAAVGGQIAPSAESGILTVIAAPWGQVSAIVGPEEIALPLPGEAFTPLAIEAPPGSYRVEVSRPGSELASCEVEVVAGSVAECRVALGTPDVSEYFREAGWWR